jgi:hypothetical protein
VIEITDCLVWEVTVSWVLTGTISTGKEMSMGKATQKGGQKDREK